MSFQALSSPPSASMPIPVQYAAPSSPYGNVQLPLIPASFPTPYSNGIRPLRALSPQEVQTVKMAENQRWRSIHQPGLDVPVTNLISSPTKNAARGAFAGGLFAALVASALSRSWSVIYTLAFTGAGFFGAMAYSGAKSKNALANNLLQHGVTHYDNLPRRIKLSQATWQRLDQTA
ncbi:MAG: hypothetical protein VKJ04_03480 [Vampirovibrionales bacterium]|nr:hypothetical protein [Vampirovibrionales bacterium]